MAAPILVTGATGRQGGAVARHLLDRGRAVRALTRDPTGKRARALADRGAELIKGDLDDRDSLVRAVAGAAALFSVQDPWVNGVPGEIRQGKLLADAAKQAQLPLVVYGSVGTADEYTGIHHFESKGTIERYMRTIGLRVVAIRPAFFMDSLLARWDRRAPYVLGALRRALRGGTIQLTAADDIGRAAADALCGPVPAADQVIDLAGDQLSVAEVIETFVRVRGRKPRVIDVPFTIMRVLNKEAYENFRWIGEVGWRFDLSRIRAARPWVQRFEPWLRAHS